jgi:nucleoside-diphosphate kinase
MVWEGRDAVKTGRGTLTPPSYSSKHPLLTSLTALLGATNPLASQPGTIRGDFAIDGSYSQFCLQCFKI